MYKSLTRRSKDDVTKDINAFNHTKNEVDEVKLINNRRETFRESFLMVERKLF